MFLKASQFIFIIYFICFIGISIARPKGDDSEKPSETDNDSPKEREPEENKEDSTEKAIEEEIKKPEETVSELAPVVPDIVEAEKEKGDEVAEEIPSTEKSSETIEEVATAETEEESKNETPEEKPETTSAAAMVNTETIIEKEEAPKDTFAVWSDERKICLLAKFHAVFSIIYSSQRGEEKAEVTIPKTANSKGKCGPNTRLPVLQLSWGKYVFKMVFNKTDEENWTLTSMELTYDTAEPLFDGAVNDLCCLLNFSFDNT